MYGNNQPQNTYGQTPIYGMGPSNTNTNNNLKFKYNPNGNLNQTD